MSASDEPLYLILARDAVRCGSRLSPVFVQELVARIDRDAAALKAAQPRIITTEAELDALPGETVVRDLGGMIYERDYIINDLTNKWWLETGSERHYQNNRVELPATVLYEPEA